MNNIHSKEVIYSPVHIKPLLKLILGENYEQRAVIHYHTPKNLFRDGKLILAQGSKQLIKIYGDLTEAEMQSIREKLFQNLSQVRDDSYAPVVIEFYHSDEIFQPGRDRMGSPEDGELLNRFVFPETE